jgi:hypothetical protein
VLDLAPIYEYVRIAGSTLVNKIFEYDSKKALIIYEFYTELIYCTRTMNVFDDFDTRINGVQGKVKIELYKIDETFNRRVEKYNYAIRNGDFRDMEINLGRMLNQEIMDFESDYKSAHATRSSKGLTVQVFSMEDIFGIITKKSEIYTNGQ